MTDFKKELLAGELQTTETAGSLWPISERHLSTRNTGVHYWKWKDLLSWCISSCTLFKNNVESV